MVGIDKNNIYLDIAKADTTLDSIYASSKKIREDEVRHTKITEKRDIEKIRNILLKLPEPKERRFSEINLRTNPRNWILSLIDSYPEVDETKMEMLLNDFSDSMQTRMREESKYAMAMLLKNELVLCHSIFGEETITPEWKAIPRMLDSDNVLRYVCFERHEDSSILVKYYEKWATESFVDWLGLPQKDSFYYFGGKYRIYSKIENTNVVLELTEEELDRWLEIHPEIREGKIRLSNPISVLTFNQIRVGRKKYENVGDFIQDFVAEKYNINFYREKFEELTSSPKKKTKEDRLSGPIELYLYKFYDEKDKVVKVEGGESVIVLEKINPHIDILFVCKDIEIRSSYLDDIFVRFANGERINIVHPGMSISADPIAIGSMEIWNEIEVMEFTNHLIGYYHGTKLQDEYLFRVLEFAIFKTLAEANKKTHLYHFLEPFAKRTIQEVDSEGRLTKLEDEILEFKPQEYFSGGDDEIIEKLVSDLSVKLQSSLCKIYLIGVEDDGTFNPIPSSRLKSDRVERVRRTLEEKLRPARVYLTPIIQEGKGLLVLIVGDLNG